MRYALLGKILQWKTSNNKIVSKLFSQKAPGQHITIRNCLAYPQAAIARKPTPSLWAFSYESPEDQLSKLGANICGGRWIFLCFRCDKDQWKSIRWLQRHIVSRFVAHRSRQRPSKEPSFYMFKDTCRCSDNNSVFNCSKTNYGHLFSRYTRSLSRFRYI